MTPLFYFLLCGAVFVAAAAASGTYCANVFGIHQSPAVGRKEALDAMFRLLLYVPAVLIALIAAAVAKRRSVWMALIAFVVGMAPLTVKYAIGHWNAVIAMALRKWTAAALSVGLLPFSGLFWVALAGLSAGLILMLTKPCPTSSDSRPDL